MSILAKHHFKILWVMIIIYILVFLGICFWKYPNFGYNSLDLSIFNQVFYNTAHGHPFALSIHAPSYLGDHFVLLVFLLLPFYLLFQSPLTLLVIQTVFIALAAWPLYLVSKNIFSNPKYYLFLPLIYLINPFVNNVNVFEFHELPFCFFIFFFAFYFYQKKKFAPWLIFLILGLLVREDVSFFVFGFGLLALLDAWLNKEKVRWSWVLTPIIISLVYFFVAMKIISIFNPGHSYKFVVYYSWLGSNLSEIIKNFILHPHLIILKIWRWKHFESLLGLLLPFLFLPLLKSRYLILALGTFLQLTITDIGASLVIIQLHYVTLLIIPAFIASGYALENLLNQPKWQNYQTPITVVLLLATVYCTITLGFGWPDKDRPEIIAVKKQLMSEVPADGRIITSYEFLPFYSQSKSHLLNYSFLNRKQLSTMPYELTDEVDYLLADLGEIIIYQLQYQKINFYRADYFKGAANLRKLIADKRLGLINLQDTVAIFKRDAPATTKLYQLETDAPVDVFDCNYANPDNATESETTLNFFCQVQFAKSVPDNYQLELTHIKNGLTTYSRLLPIAYGFYNTSELKPEERLTTTYSLVTLPQADERVCLNLIEIKGAIVLNRLGSLQHHIDKKTILKTHCLPPAPGK